MTSGDHGLRRAPRPLALVRLQSRSSKATRRLRVVTPSVRAGWHQCSLDESRPDVPDGTWPRLVRDAGAVKVLTKRDRRVHRNLPGRALVEPQWSEVMQTLPKGRLQGTNPAGDAGTDN
jgi:hypothetical protein